MQTVEQRTKERFPAVLLTLLSIVQALALEVLWSSAHAHEYLFEGGLTALIGWLQVSAIFLGIIVVWLFYSSLLMRLVWVPSTRDSLIPFFMGAAEFLLAEILAPEYLPLWLVVMASMFAFSAWTSRRTFLLARLDPENADFFANFTASTPRDMMATGIAVGVLLLGGGAVLLAGPSGGVALAAVIAANITLIGQAYMIRYFWNRSLGLGKKSASN